MSLNPQSLDNNDQLSAMHLPPSWSLPDRLPVAAMQGAASGLSIRHLLSSLSDLQTEIEPVGRGRLPAATVAIQHLQHPTHSWSQDQDYR